MASFAGVWGQGKNADTFLGQFTNIAKAGLTHNGAFLNLTIMDFAGLFGEIIANVTAVFGDFLLQLAQFGKRRAKRLYLFALCWQG